MTVVANLKRLILAPAAIEVIFASLIAPVQAVEDTYRVFMPVAFRGPIPTRDCGAGQSVSASVAPKGHILVWLSGLKKGQVVAGSVFGGRGISDPEKNLGFEIDRVGGNWWSYTWVPSRELLFDVQVPYDSDYFLLASNLADWDLGVNLSWQVCWPQ